MNPKFVNVKEITSKQSKLYTLTDALKPILIGQMLFGIQRFSLSNNPENCVNWKTRIYSLAILCGTLISFYFFHTFAANNPEMCYLQRSISVVVLIKIIITILFISLRKHPEAVQVFNMFTEIDSDLRLNHSDQFYKSRRKFYSYMVAAIIGSYSTIIFYDRLLSQLFSRADQLYLFFGCVMHDLDILAFLALAKEIRIRIALVNRNISGNMLNAFVDCSCHEERSKMQRILDCLKPNRRVCYNKLMNPGLDHLGDVCLMTEKVVQLCVEVNRLYNMQLFQSLVSKFIYLLLLVETMIDFDGRRYFLDVTFVIYVTLFVFLQLVILQFVCTACDKVTEETYRTAVILNKILVDCDVDKRSRRQTKVMVKLFESKPPSFTVYGMFTMNLGLMLSFIGLTTTYVIVLMQYTSMHSNNASVFVNNSNVGNVTVSTWV